MMPRTLPWTRFLCAVVALFVWVSSGRAEQILPLDETSDGLWLGTHTDLLEDVTGQQSFDDIRDSTAFVTQHEPVPRFFLTDSAMWGRVRLHNTGDTALTRYIVMSDPVLQEIDFYIEDARGHVRHLQSGSLRAHRVLDVDNRLPVVTLHLQPGEQATLWTRIKTVYPSSMPL